LIEKKSPLPGSLEYYPIFTAFFLSLFHLLLFISGKKELWVDRGAVSSAILEGEWWRTVTALTLHADFLHLISNLLLGIVTIGTVRQLIGKGTGWLLVLSSGIAGNWINILVQPSGHLAIGASTAVFGSIGIITGLRLTGNEESPWRFWIPLGGGLALLGILGSGKGTDLGAHLFGFLSGLVLGISAAKFLIISRKRKTQYMLVLLSGLIVIFSWVNAFF
jgi:membrane associated rhomboid family serine protease